MYLSPLVVLTALAAVTQTVYAVPTSFMARGIPLGTDLNICTDAYYKGRCYELFVEHDTCTTFPTGFQNDVSSVQSPGPWACTLYFSSLCDLSEGSLTIPPNTDIESLSYGNNAFNSVFCPLQST